MTLGSYSIILSTILLAYQTGTGNYSSLNPQISSQLISLEESISYKDRSGTQVKCKEKVSLEVEFESKRILCKVNLTPENLIIYYKREKNTSEELSIQLNNIKDIVNIIDYNYSEDSRTVPGESGYSYPIRKVSEYHLIAISFINPQNAKLEKVYISAAERHAHKIDSLLKESINNIETCNLVDESSASNSRQLKKIYTYRCNN